MVQLAPIVASLVRLAIAAAALASAGCAGIVPFAPTAALGGRSASCTPAFPYEDGWAGGDAAYSIPLPGARRSLWVFGDSFVASASPGDRSSARLVHNSIAISECRANGDWRIDYFWGTDASGAARAFFASEEASIHWWPLDGFVHDESLYLTLLRVGPAQNGGWASFDFDGVDIARIHNPLDPPVAWRIDFLRLWRDGMAFPGSAAVLHGDHVYLATFLSRPEGSRPRTLVRVDLDRLASATVDLHDDLESLREDGTWRRGLDPADLAILMDDDATEMSIHRDPDLDRWVAIYGHPDLSGAGRSGLAGARVFARTAESLEGPWSARETLFVMPELDPESTAGHLSGTFCYASKAHEQFSPPGRVLLTYVCNLAPSGEGDLAGIVLLRSHPALYRPRVVSIPLD